MHEKRINAIEEQLGHTSQKLAPSRLSVVYAGHFLMCAPLCSPAKVIAMLRDWFVAVVSLGERSRNE
jgi:hypothetical protein